MRFKKVHLLYNQDCIYKREIRTHSETTYEDIPISKVRIQSQDILVDDADKSNSSGGFALYYLIDSVRPSQGLNNAVFEENSKIVYLGKEYVIKSVKMDTIRDDAQYKVVFK